MFAHLEMRGPWRKKRKKRKNAFKRVARFWRWFQAWRRQYSVFSFHRRRELKFRHRARRFFMLLSQVFDSEVVANENNSSEFCLSRKKHSCAFRRSWAG